jgi:hypothetical protein
VVLVASRETCLGVKAALASNQGPNEDLAVNEAVFGPYELPSYPLAVALRERSGIPYDLVREARDGELFGSSSSDTAALYAAVVLESLVECNPAGIPDEPVLGPVLRIADFGLANRGFRMGFYRSLMLGIRGVLRRQAEATGVVSGYDAIMSGSSEMAVALAENLLPPAWLHELEVTALSEPSLFPGRPAAVPDTGRFTTCQSCSVSLLEEGHRGASARYCRFCSDDTGKLKPRQEVQRLLAGWFQNSRTGLADEEAMRRAGLYMMAMPAWARPVKSTRLLR